jgi:cyclopropane fatty-acyl-phospholipid synthase-like methyltransferase
MKTVLANDFIKMIFDSSNNFMETIWTTSIMMGQEEYRKVLKLYLEQLQLHRPNKLLIDSREAQYVITPNDQDWINEHIYPQTAQAGVRKLAFLIGTDLFMSISLEQVAEDSQKSEVVKSVMKQQFFDNHQSAVEWLNSGN